MKRHQVNNAVEQVDNRAQLFSSLENIRNVQYIVLV